MGVAFCGKRGAPSARALLRQTVGIRVGMARMCRGVRAMAHTLGARKPLTAAHAVMGRLYAHMCVLFSLKDQTRGDA